jgi:4-amino-4-deoxy-L-arabinose transferase-like glycosyltransferase
MRGLAVALLPMVLLITARWASPNDLLRTDQAKGGLYVIDIVERGNVILPMERGIKPATKPPFYHWLAAGACFISGGVSEAACRIPSVLAALAVTALIFIVGRERWNPVVGIAAAWLFATAQTAARLCIFIRPDMVLTVCTTLSLFALHRIEQGRTNRMPMLFWLGLSLAILAKGPPGLIVVFGAVGLLAFSKEWRPSLGTALKSPWCLLLAIPAVWFFLAYVAGGEAYLRGTVIEETLSRAAGQIRKKQDPPGYLFGQYVSRTAPWTLVSVVAAVIGLIRGTPSIRLAAAWLIGGLILFNVSRGQRLDYVLPLLPGAALLLAASLDEASNKAAHYFWFWTLVLTAIAGLTAGGLILAGLGRVLPDLDEMPESCRWLGGMSLILCGLCSAWAAWRSPHHEAASQLRPSFFVASAGMTVLMIGYFAAFSEDALSRESDRAIAFAADVQAIVKPEEELRYFGEMYLSEIVPFCLGRNYPDISESELRLRLSQKKPGKFWLITTQSEVYRAFSMGWPRMELRARRSLGVGRGVYYLLEVLP